MITITANDKATPPQAATTAATGNESSFTFGGGLGGGGDGLRGGGGGLGDGGGGLGDGGGGLGDGGGGLGGGEATGGGDDGGMKHLAQFTGQFVTYRGSLHLASFWAGVVTPLTG